jgi:hypothetical protein
VTLITVYGLQKLSRGFEKALEQRNVSYASDTDAINQTRWKAMSKIGLKFQGFSAFQNFDADVGMNRLSEVLQRILQYLPKPVFVIAKRYWQLINEGCSASLDQWKQVGLR